MDGNPGAPVNGAGQFTIDLDPGTAGIQTTFTDGQGALSEGSEKATVESDYLKTAHRFDQARADIFFANGEVHTALYKLFNGFFDTVMEKEENGETYFERTETNFFEQVLPLILRV